MGALPRSGYGARIDEKYAMTQKKGIAGIN